MGEPDWEPIAFSYVVESTGAMTSVVAAVVTLLQALSYPALRLQPRGARARHS